MEGKNAREEKSAISHSTATERQYAVGKDEGNTIGGDIDLPWELPCATSWWSSVRATSRFFFGDSTASRRRRLAIFPPSFLYCSSSLNSLRTFRRVPPFFTRSPRKSLSHALCHTTLVLYTKQSPTLPFFPTASFRRRRCRLALRAKDNNRLVSRHQ